VTGRMLNVGCGECFHPDWENADLAPTRPEVHRVDVTRGLPYGPESFDVVYHSHVLEHLDRRGAELLLLECWRVLANGGILRVVVPDLESICRLYLDRLDRARAGDVEAVADHGWMTLELLDQLVRDRPGGELGRRLASKLENEDFVRSRVDASLIDGPAPVPTLGPRPRRSLARGLARRLTQGRMHLARSSALVTAGHRGARAFDEGSFRATGEVHRWMYDELSLGDLLGSCGFQEVKRVDAFTSAIPGWDAYALDGREGVVRKPDSLFMEAKK
jgi:hypothetical protein